MQSIDPIGVWEKIDISESAGLGAISIAPIVVAHDLLIGHFLVPHLPMKRETSTDTSGNATG